MASVQEHYDQHLGPVYAWMVGGVEPAIERGAAEMENLGTGPSETGFAVDLGAGFGMHAIPLARQGFNVLALDSCANLLEELRSHAQQESLPVEIVQDDLRSFQSHLPGKPELVLCMHDTLTHLPDAASVETLIQAVAAEIAPGGRFILTLRDYSTALTGVQRFIPVRSDASRILTCFLEYAESHVQVHDILHEWDGSAWSMGVSAYPKLRISPEWLVATLEQNGFAVEQGAGPGGMVRFAATRLE